MAETASTRFGLPLYSSGTDDWFARLGWNAFIALLEATVGYTTQGLLSARPATGKARAFYYATDQKRLYYWDTAATPSATWVEISPVGAGNQPSVQGALVGGSAGTSRAAAREDHAHAVPTYGAITLATGWLPYGGGTPSFQVEGRRCYLSGAARWAPLGVSTPIPTTLSVLSGTADELPDPYGYSSRMPHLLAALGQNNVGSSTTDPIGFCHVRPVNDGQLRIYRMGSTPGDVVFLDGLSYRVA